MENLDIEYLIQNFFGMSLKYQLLFREEIKKSYYRSDAFNSDKTVINDFFKVYQEFDNLFGEYYFDKITLYLESKDEYDKLNSNQRRNLRYRTLKTLESMANNHRNESDEEKQRHFIYMNSIRCNTSNELNEIINSHFHPETISDEDAEEYIELYRIMECNDQKDFLGEMYNYYKRADISLICGDYHASYNIIQEYDTIIKKLFGDDLFIYYNDLSNEEKIYVINDIASIIKSYKTTYDSELELDRNHVVKYQKMRTLDACQRSITKR